MSKQVIADARSAYATWKDSQPGSYVERVIADAIAREILPALLHILERGPIQTGFTQNDPAPIGAEAIEASAAAPA